MSDKLPSGLALSLLSSGHAYLTGTYEVSGKISLQADKVIIWPTKPLSEPLTCHYQKTVLDDGTEGYLISEDLASNGSVTLDRPDGTSLTTKSKRTVRQKYPTYTFATEEKQNVQIRLLFYSGIKYEITSQLSSGQGLSSGATIRQTFSISNKTSYDLEDIKDTILSFQNSRGSRREDLATLESKAVDMSPAEEVSAPIKLGPLKMIGKYTSVTLDPPRSVEIKILSEYVDIFLGQSNCNAT